MFIDILLQNNQNSQVKQDGKENFELLEIRSYPPFPNNENAELKDRVPVEFA